jgi:dTDP-glucose 4,6-dehydratase
MMILVTGGAGFTGSSFVIDWLAHHDEAVVNLDKLTYAGNLNNLASLDGNENHVSVNGDIGNTAPIRELLEQGKIHMDGESKTVLNAYFGK